MQITKVQLRTWFDNHIRNKDKGLNDVLEMTLNSMMSAERREVLADQGGFNKANVYRPGRVYGNGQILELRIPRDRNGQFHPKVLTLLRTQQAEPKAREANRRYAKRNGSACERPLRAGSHPKPGGTDLRRTLRAPILLLKHRTHDAVDEYTGLKCTTRTDAKCTTCTGAKCTTRTDAKCTTPEWRIWFNPNATFGAKTLEDPWQTNHCP